MAGKQRDKKPLGWIYQLTSPSGQIYIGQTKNLSRRMEAYSKLECKSQKLLYVSLRDWGFKAHKLTILKRCAWSTMDKWEIYYINTCQSCYRDNKLYGLNVLKESYEEYCALKGIKPKRTRKKRSKGYSFQNITL